MMARDPNTTTQTSSAKADTSSAPQDAPPKPAVEDEEITNKPGAIEAVKPEGVVEPLDENADYVEYKGKATTRRITADQWAQARVPDQNEVVWEKSNEYKVSISDLSDKALQLLAHDGSFALPKR
jgi:hypothetical protein